jgi:hypothetical protein
MATYDKVFSDFEVKETSIKFANDVSAEAIGCVGSLEESFNVKTITKKCEGTVIKTKVKSDGSGELKVSLHMKYDLYVKTFGMMFNTLKDGVYAYGSNSNHEAFALTAKVLDEDNIVKYIAYPNCVASSGIAKKIENGAEEVAEMELTIAVARDDYGHSKYEAIESELTDETVKTTWLTNFNYDLVKQTV